jgi:S1-C subfamily serine protease
LIRYREDLVDAYSRTVAQIELSALQDGKAVPCGFATGFFYRRENKLYLITNWHVVTGIDPTTLEPLAPGPLPDVLTFYYKQSVDMAGKPAAVAAGSNAVASPASKRTFVCTLQIRQSGLSTVHVRTSMLLLSD